MSQKKRRGICSAAALSKKSAKCGRPLLLTKDRRPTKEACRRCQGARGQPVTRYNNSPATILRKSAVACTATTKALDNAGQLCNQDRRRSTLDAQRARRRFAAECFNHDWENIERPNRTAADGGGDSVGNLGQNLTSLEAVGPATV
jgi:hypothetical protein